MSVARIDDGLRRRLLALLEQLPVLPNRRCTIPMEVECLYLAAGFAGVNDLPRAKEAGSKAARRGLDKLCRLSVALGLHIRSLHDEALAVIEDRHPLALVDDLRALAKASERKLKTTVGKNNLHAKHRAGETTAYAADLYERLTGKRATRVSKSMAVNSRQGTVQAGEFHNFLAEMFKLLNIKASADGQLKLLYGKRSRKNG